MKDRELEAYVQRTLEMVYPDARRTNNSGAVSSNGDVLAGSWLVDAKGTSRHNFIVTFNDWQKSRRQAWHQRKEPLFIRSNGDDGILATMEMTLLIELLGELERFRALSQK